MVVSAEGGCGWDLCGSGTVRRAVGRMRAAALRWSPKSSIAGVVVSLGRPVLMAPVDAEVFLTLR